MGHGTVQHDTHCCLSDGLGRVSLESAAEGRRHSCDGRRFEEGQSGDNRRRGQHVHDAVLPSKFCL